VVLLLFSGGPLDIREAVNNPGLSAIFQCFFPAQTTGEAIYNILVNKRPLLGPAGRLPFTWYSSDEQASLSLFIRKSYNLMYTAISSIIVR